VIKTNCWLFAALKCHVNLVALLYFTARQRRPFPILSPQLPSSPAGFYTYVYVCFYIYFTHQSPPHSIAFISHTWAIYLFCQRKQVTHSLPFLPLAYWPCPQFHNFTISQFQYGPDRVCCYPVFAVFSPFAVAITFASTLVGSLINATVMQIAHKTPCYNMWSLIEKRKST